MSEPRMHSRLSGPHVLISLGGLPVHYTSMNESVRQVCLGERERDQDRVGPHQKKCRPSLHKIIWRAQNIRTGILELRPPGLKSFFHLPSVDTRS